MADGAFRREHPWTRHQALIGYEVADREPLTPNQPLQSWFRLNQSQMAIGPMVNHVDAFGFGVAEDHGARP